MLLKKDKRCLELCKRYQLSLKHEYQLRSINLEDTQQAKIQLAQVLASQTCTLRESILVNILAAQVLLTEREHLQALALLQ